MDSYRSLKYVTPVKQSFYENKENPRTCKLVLIQKAIFSIIRLALDS